MSERVWLEGLVFPEAPRWHDGRLFLSDILAGHVVAVDGAGKLEVIVEVPGRPSGLGWDPQGRLLIVSMTDGRLLRLEDGVLLEVADLSPLVSSDCNDMVVDASGRAYVGSLGFDFESGEAPRTADLIRIDPDGTASIAARDLAVPNGSVITPDDRTLIVGESLARRYTAFDLGPDGRLTGRRIWAELDGVGPDGCCIDAECGIWAAIPARREVVRVLEGGQVTQRISTRQRPIACMLGGADRRTLFVLTAVSLRREKCERHRDACILAVDVDVPGAGRP